MSRRVVLDSNKLARIAGNARAKAEGKEAQLWPEEYCDGFDGLVKFLTDVVWTFDESEAIAKKLPMEKSYMVDAIARPWYETMETGRPFLCIKSRRMVASWTLRAMELWDAGRRRTTQILCHKTYSEAAEHVWRYYFIYENIRKNNPSWRLPFRGRNHGAIGSLQQQQVSAFALTNGSLLKEANSDADNLQGVGVTRITFEELFKYKDPLGLFAQGKTICEGSATSKGGHLVAVTNSSSRTDVNPLRAKPGSLRSFYNAEE